MLGGSHCSPLRIEARDPMDLPAVQRTWPRELGASGSFAPGSTALGRLGWSAAWTATAMD